MADFGIYLSKLLCQRNGSRLFVVNNKDSLVFVEALFPVRSEALFKLCRGATRGAAAAGSSASGGGSGSSAPAESMGSEAGLGGRTMVAIGRELPRKNIKQCYGISDLHNTQLSRQKILPGWNKNAALYGNFNPVDI